MILKISGVAIARSPTPCSWACTLLWDTCNCCEERKKALNLN